MNAKNKMSIADIAYNGACGILFTLFALICIFPFYYLFICTISDPSLVEVGKIVLLPRGITLKNYIEVLRLPNLANATMITLGRTALGTGSTLLVTAYLAYFFTKTEMWGRKFWYRMVVATMYFSAGMIPVYLNNKMLGLLNSFWIYIIPGLVGVYNMILVKTSMEALPVKEAEIKALQQQINPHFMNNIMETIMGLASEGMDDEVIQVSECMSDMLRYNTRFENITTLRDELEQVKNYVSILKIRFEGRFEAYYDVGEECIDCSMVKFTLQPLVENAISHGLSETEKGGMIRIRVKKEGERISILIYDNGIGMSEEMRTELEQRLLVTAERPLEYIDQYKSLGILNVHLRLRMYYGEAYSIELFSKEGKGTCFSIKIPFVKSREGAAIQLGGLYVSDSGGGR